MTHVRTQIRDQFVNTLEATLPHADYIVYRSRNSARNRDDNKAIVDLRILNVNIEQTTMGDERTHTASLYIRVQRDERREDLDDALDADEVFVTAAVEAADWTTLLEEDPELVQVNFSNDFESSSSLGAIILRYDIEYRISKANPEQVRS